MLKKPKAFLYDGTERLMPADAEGCGPVDANGRDSETANDRLALLEAFRGLRVLVIGDTMLDSYILGSSSRLCQEAPVPIIDFRSRADMPGGAGNCAANLAALGAAATILGAVGNDPEADALCRLLAERNVATSDLLRADERRTLSKTRITSDQHTVARLDQGCTAPIDAATQARLLERLDAAYASADLVVVSDYGYGVLTPAIIERLKLLKARAPKVLVVDAKDFARFRQVGMTACKPNYPEAIKLLGLPAAEREGPRWSALWDQGEELLGLTAARIVAVTLDSEGGLVFERGCPPVRTYARTAPQSQTAGAGDSYLATLALALAAGATTRAAAELASMAADIAVSKRFTATCSNHELKQRLGGRPTVRYDLPSLLPSLAEHRRHHRHIVLTSGCFDILHGGHVAYLEQARRLGDVLIVGVNTDGSIRRLKGPGRPINTLTERLSVLAGLGCIDHLVAFDEETPHRLIEAIQPNVFVKGGDYTRQTLPEARLVEQLGGAVQILPFMPHHSTTTIIDRIRRSKPAGDELTSNYREDRNHEHCELAERRAHSVR